MINPMKLLPALNPEAVNKKDLFIVYNFEIPRIVESHRTLIAAINAKHILNNHEIDNERKAIYRVLDLSQPIKSPE